MAAASESIRRKCPQCEAALGAEAPEGLCARCLLGSALMFGAEDLEDDRTEAALPGLVGSVVGGYEIISKIAQGGMGVVFKARQKRPDRLVALKIISAGELATPAMVQRFQNEARASARLEHPNIVSIFEVGQDRGWHFFSMQLVEGRTLADFIASKELSEREAAELLLKVARAVEHAHQHGILHRDLKPTNILLDAQDEPRLTDFGLAKFDEVDSSLTHSRAILGTPAYMSPEQASGRMRDISTATDVYGLGAILYELLWGRPVFTSENAPSLLRRIVEEEPKPPRGSDSDLEVICLKCLEKDPAQRYATAGELAAELERWLNYLPILARPAGMLERGKKWARRSPARAGLVATILLAVVLLAAGGANFTVRLSRARAETRDRLISQHMREASRLAADGDAFAGMLSLTEALRQANGQPEVEEDLRQRLSAAVIYSPRLLRLWDAGTQIARLQFSADEGRLIGCPRAGGAIVWNLAANEQLLAPPGATLSFAAPNGAIVLEAFANAPFARLRHLDTGRVVPLAVDVAPTAGAFRPDSRVVATGDTLCRLWDVETGAEIPSRIRQERGTLSLLAFRPDGKALLGGYESGTGALWFLDAGKRFSFADGLEQRFPQPEFSPNSQWLLASWEKQLRLMNAHSGAIFKTVPHGFLPDAAFSADSQSFTLAHFREQATAIDHETWRYSPTLYRHESGANRVAWNPDGTMTATAGFDHQVRVPAGLRSGMAPRLRQGGIVDALAFSGSGRFLACANALGVVQIWDLAPRGRKLLNQGLVPRNAEMLIRGEILPHQHASGARQVNVFTGEESLSLSFSEAPVFSGWDRAGRYFGSVREGKGEVRDWKSGSRLFSTDIPQPPGGLIFSPDSSRVLFLSADGRLQQFALPGGEPVGLVMTNRGKPTHAAWSPDSRWIVTAHKGDSVMEPSAQREVIVFEAATGKALAPAIPAPFGANPIRFSPQSDRLLVGFSDSHIEPSFAQCYEVPSLKPLGPRLRHGDGVQSGAFSSDGTWIATGGQDNYARIWRVANGSPGPVMAHGAIVSGVAFSADGKCLATGSQDGFFRLWDAASGDLVAPPVDLLAQDPVLAFTRNGQDVVVNDSARFPWLLTRPQINYSLEDFERLAICSSGLAAGTKGAGSPMPAEELARLFALLARSQPQDFAWPSDSLDFHEQKAALAERGASRFAALFHLKRLPLSPEVAQRIAALEKQSAP